MALTKAELLAAADELAEWCWKWRDKVPGDRPPNNFLQDALAIVDRLRARAAAMEEE